MLLINFVPLNSNDEFDSTESDELLEDLMTPVEDMEDMDYRNQVSTYGGHSSLIYTVV